jgi:hypothetical protein
MSYRETADRWDTWRVRLRERVYRHLPKFLTHYPFETVVAFVALLMGLPYLLGVAAPASLLALVGAVAFHFWASALAIGGATIAASMVMGDRPHPLVLASGLQLAAGAFAVYAIGVAAVLGFAGLTSITAYAMLSVISLIRATHFRRLIDIQKGATRLKESGR